MLVGFLKNKVKIPYRDKDLVSLHLYAWRSPFEIKWDINVVQGAE